MKDEEKAQEVASCLKNVNKLTLNCWITERGAIFLAESLRELSKPVSVLND